MHYLIWFQVSWSYPCICIIVCWTYMLIIWGSHHDAGESQCTAIMTCTLMWPKYSLPITNIPLQSVTGAENQVNKWCIKEKLQELTEILLNCNQNEKKWQDNIHCCGNIYTEIWEVPVTDSLTYVSQFNFSPLNPGLVKLVQVEQMPSVLEALLEGECLPPYRGWVSASL